MTQGSAILRDRLRLQTRIQAAAAVAQAPPEKDNSEEVLQTIADKLDMLVRLMQKPKDDASATGDTSGATTADGSGAKANTTGADGASTGTGGEGAEDTSADGVHQMLGNSGFEHISRHQIGPAASAGAVDMYNHPAGHTAVVQSQKGAVKDWGLSYGRGLGSPSGTGAPALQQHLNQSAGFLKNEGLRKPVK
jgi:hypothetical protein